jgi:hypothetical protein
MNNKLAFVLFAFAFVVALVVGLGSREDIRPAPAEFRAKFEETLLKPRKIPAPVAVPAEPARTPASGQGDRRPAGGFEPVAVEKSEGEPLNREAFSAKYGERLEFTVFEGRVIRIDGSGVPDDAFASDQKVSGFRPGSDADVIARAREVFANTRRLLGIPERAEYSMSPPNKGETTSQVVMNQTEKGIPISPGGLVTILLGPNGEVRGVDSSIYPKTEIENSVALPRPAAAREILFVTQSAPVALLRHAYETREGGIQRVVDAESGEVLLDRDRRIK